MISEVKINSHKFDKIVKKKGIYHFDSLWYSQYLHKINALLTKTQEMWRSRKTAGASLLV